MNRALLLVLALVSLPARALPIVAEPRLEREARVTWRAEDERFGGFSGFDIAADGVSFLAISDRGAWARGRLERDGDGRLSGARLEEMGPLLGTDGTPLDGNNVDAEGLAVDGRGRAFVSFEAFHRVRRYDDIAGPARAVPSDPSFARLSYNSGLETLAVDAGDRLYTIPERSGALYRPFPVLRLDGLSWTRVGGVPRRGDFLVTDADFGPDGRLYVLERDFRWLGGFATRIRSFALGPGDLTDEVELFRAPFGTLDNMEGIDVGTAADGGIRVTLLSDDNFFPLQRTDFVEFRLVE